MKLKIFIILVLLICSIQITQSAAVYDIPTNTITLSSGSHNFSTIDSDVSNSTAWNYNSTTEIAILTAKLLGPGTFSSTYFSVYDGQTLQINCSYNGQNYISLTKDACIKIYGNVTIESIGAGRGYITVRDNDGSPIQQYGNNNTNRLHLKRLGTGASHPAIELQGLGLNLSFFNLTDSLYGIEYTKDEGTATEFIFSDFNVSDSNGYIFDTHDANAFIIKNGTISNYKIIAGMEGTRTGDYTIIENVDFSDRLDTVAEVTIKAKERDSLIVRNCTFTNISRAIGIYINEEDWDNWNKRIQIYDNTFEKVGYPISWTKGQAEIYNNVYNHSSIPYYNIHRMVKIYNETITNTTNKLFTVNSGYNSYNITFQNMNLDTTNDVNIEESGTKNLDNLFFIDTDLFNPITIIDMGNSNIQFINCNESYGIPSLTNSFFKPSYYKDVYVQSPESTAVRNAIITITNNINVSYPPIHTNGTELTQIISESNGHTPLPNSVDSIVLTDYLRDSTGILEEMNYTVTATHNGLNRLQTITGNNDNGYSMNGTTTITDITSKYYRINPNTIQNTTTVIMNYVGNDYFRSVATTQTDVIGCTGSWSNVTLDSNATITKHSSNIELQDAVPDFMSKWTFNNGSLLDESGNYDITNYGAVASNNSIFGESFYLNGSVYMSANEGIAAYPYTIMAWSNSSATATYQTIMGISDTTRTNRYSVIGINNLNQSHAIHRYTSSSTSTHQNTININDWTHTAGTYVNSSYRNVYSNGVEGSTPATVTLSNLFNDKILFGVYRLVDPGAYMNGYITDCRIYLRMLSTEEINLCMNNAHKLSTTIISNTRDSGANKTLLNASWSGSSNNNQTVDIYANTSIDGTTNWSGNIPVKLNALPDINYNVNSSNNERFYILTYNITTNFTSETVIIDSLVAQFGNLSQPSFDRVIIQEDRNNESHNLIVEFSNYSASLEWINNSWSGTENGNTYHWNYWNGTEISSQTATSNNTTLWFNHTVAEIPEGKYYISETLGQSTMTILANSWGMFNNWTSQTTFSGIAANESNDICYTYYNVTSRLWESYYVGYSWNADYQLSKDASVIGYFDAQTDITSNIITPSSTELYTGWNMAALQGSSNQTISGIITDIGVNCSDSWYFNSSTGSYSNMTTHSIQPNQGFLAYITQNMTWSRSAM